MDVIYLPRKSISRDDLFGEDIQTKFNDNFMIEMYLESVDGFEGDGEILSQIGLQIKDSATFVVAKRRFEEVVWNNERPLEGDLLYFPLSNAIFEITFVDNENPFYQTGRLHSYKLTCQLFTFSHEEFKTGYDDIDSINETHNKDEQIDLADNDEVDTISQTILDPNARGQTNVSDDPRFDETNPFGEF